MPMLTGPAFAGPIGRDVRVRWRELVAVDAVRFVAVASAASSAASSSRCPHAPDVLGVQDRLEVGGIAASSVEAQVVNLMPRRNRPDQLGVGHTVH
jgi:hypothetical protein